MRAMRPSHAIPTAGMALGLRANWRQFSLLVLVNAFVGAMVGMERSILPALAEHEFKLVAHTAILAFIVVFGISKALTNYLAGRLSDTYGRKVVLVVGWLIATPVPFLLMWAPSWNWVLLANLFLGVSQGLTWSTTVIMKIDLAGPENRGTAMGINEFAGYFAVGGAALATGWIAAHYGLRPQPFYPGVAFALIGLLLSALLVRETRGHAQHEATLAPVQGRPDTPSQKTIFWQTSLRDPDLLSAQFCWVSGPQWCIRLCWPRSVTLSIQPGGHRRWASIDCGGIWDTRSALFCQGWLPMHSAWKARCGSSLH